MRKVFSATLNKALVIRGFYFLAMAKHKLKIYKNMVTKLIQTKLKTESQRGNCHPTAIACLLGLENPEEMLQFQEYFDSEDILWIDKLNDWLEERGYELDYLSGHQFDDSIYIVSGKTERETSHCCLYKNGKLWHDVHPSQSGLLTEKNFSTIVKTQVSEGKNKNFV